MLFIALSFIAIGSVSAGQTQSNPTVSVISQRQYDECSGKDSVNYTLWTEQTTDLSGSLASSDNVDHQLVQCGPNQQRAVNSLRRLASSGYPSGAYSQVEQLWLVTGGPLQGKYVYEKMIHLDLEYLKRFSSVLGYSYVTTKSATLLISDHLDLSVLISPTGAFDVFKRGCNTQCRGQGWWVA